MNEQRTDLRLRLGHLYPDQLNMYGDRGNILTLLRRCEWRGIQLDVIALDVGAELDPAQYDLFFIGGGNWRGDPTVNPASNDVDFGVVQFDLAGRHLARDQLVEQQAFRRRARYDDRARGSTLEDRFRCA